MTNWGSPGTEAAQFNLPYAVRAGGNGVVYVADSSNHRIQKFQFATPRFRRADGNQDGDVNISDAVCILNWLFLGGSEPGCVAATNTNGDEAVDISDPVYLLGFLFFGGPPPVEPFPDCGTSDLETDRELGCVTPPKVCQQ